MERTLINFALRVTAALISVIVFSSLFVFADNSYVKSGNLPYGISISYYHGTNSRGFVWHTSSGITESVLRVTEAEYLESADFSNADAIYGSYISYCDTSGIYNLHFAAAENLTPEKTYAYKLGDGTGNDTTGLFSVCSCTNSLSVLTLADTKTSGDDYSALKSVLDAASATVPSPDLIAIAGDLVCKSTSAFCDAAYTLSLISDSFGSVPVALASGDCDSQTNSLYLAAGYCDADFGLSANTYGTSRPSSGGSYFVEYGSELLVIFADSNLMTSSKFTKERIRIRTMLESSECRWKIVIIHEDVYSTSSAQRSKMTALYYANLESVFRSYGADLVVSGQDLSYGKTVDAGSSESKTVRLGEKTYELFSGSIYHVTLGAAGDMSESGEGMFGALKVDGCKLTYDIYSVKNGKTTLYDSVAVYKSDIWELAENINTPNDAAALLSAYYALPEEEKAMIISVSPGIAEKIRAAEQIPEAVRIVEEDRFELISGLADENESAVSLCGIQNSTVSEGNYCVRFIASADSSEFSGCGFIITAEYSDGQKELGGYAEKLVSRAEENEQIINAYEASELNGKYLFAITVYGIPEDVGTVEFTVTPFTVSDGLLIYGNSFSVIYERGYFISVSQSVKAPD